MNQCSKFPAARLVILAVAASGLLAGCFDKKDEKKIATQVAAKVNSSEISVHQINALLAKAPPVPQELAPKLRKELLSKLVEQQLAVDKALEGKLDRNPDVMMAVEYAKREILAKAYMDQIAGAQPKPTDEEVKKYYADHPELFANRRVYSLQEIVIEKNASVPADLQQMVTSSKTMEEIANTLKSRNVQFRVAAGARPAEQIPLDMLSRLAELKDGQGALIEGSQLITITRVAASQAAPVDEATAMPKIRMFLQNQRGGQAVEAELNKLKSAAKIEYLGEFAGTEAAPRPAEKAAATEKPAVGNIEKGVAGLK